MSICTYDICTRPFVPVQDKTRTYGGAWGFCCSAYAKKPAEAGFFVRIAYYRNRQERLGSLDVGSLLALRTLGHVEGHTLSFFQGLETVHVDRGEMREQIFTTVIRSDEAKTFSVVEPLDGTSCHMYLHP